MHADLSGRVALVTGSSSGIGRSVALKLAESGADVCVNGRDPEKGEDVVSAVRALGRRAIFVPANVRDPAACVELVESTVERLGGLDILVANGGGTTPGQPKVLPNYFRDTPVEDFEEIVRSRWLSRVYPIKAAVEPMARAGYGKIIVITTDAGRWPTPGESVNGGAAAGLLMMNRVIAKEFTRWGIRLNSISISLTGDSVEEFEEVLAGPVAATFRKAVDKMPFGLTPPAEVAEAALYFAAAESDHCTGAVLSINGGLSFP